MTQDDTVRLPIMTQSPDSHLDETGGLLAGTSARDSGSDSRSVVVAIDGTSGSGKSTTAKALAELLAGDYVDTGAMYRAITWWMLQQNIDVHDAAEVGRQVGNARVEIFASPSSFSVRCNGVDVSADIRSVHVTEAVSAVAAVPAVRETLCAYQRDLAGSAKRRGSAMVMEGRDIGSVVLPDAEVKIWLEADLAARAKRRAAEGEGPVAATTERLISRDERDATRAVSPAQMAHDAVLIDTTFASVDEVVATVLEMVHERMGTNAGGPHVAT